MKRHTIENRNAQEKLANLSNMLIPGNAAPANAMQTKQKQNTPHNSHDEENVSSMLQNMLYNMQTFMLEQLPHIKEYKKLRKLHSEITTSMAQYLDDGKFEHKLDTPAAMEKNVKEPIKLRRTSVSYDMETHEGEQAYYDMNFYKMAPNANSITEAYLQSRRYRKPEKIAMLESMHNSVRGLFEITKIDSDQGYVYLKEVFTAQPFRIIDIGMSIYDTAAEMYIYRRILTLGEISMGAGVALTFEKSDKFIKEFIKREKANYHPAGEMVRFNDLYNYYTTASDRIQLKHYEMK